MHASPANLQTLELLVSNELACLTLMPRCNDDWTPFQESDGVSKHALDEHVTLFPISVKSAHTCKAML